MANLDQIILLNNIYNKKSNVTRETQFFAINESFNPDKIENLGPVYLKYFEYSLPAKIVLLFVDVCGFSTRFSNLCGSEISEYFDQYYDIVIPIIYKFGGEIDKIMGDGIVAIFGPPFQNIDLNENIRKADQCSKEIIKKTRSTKFSSKIALHNGTINYFKNKTGLYREYTIIGRPVTELFRLESISYDERINYYDETEIRAYYESKITNLNSLLSPVWIHFRKPIKNLKGVDFEQFFTINFNGD